MTMIARHLEPNHHLEDYIIYGDDDDFLQTDNYCIFAEEETPCNNCGHCEEKTFMCSEDEYDMED